MGPRHRLREPRGLRAARGLLLAGEAAPRCCCRSSLTLREILEKVFGLIRVFKSKDELLEEEFAKFVAEHEPEEPQAIPAIKTYFKAYVTSDLVATSSRVASTPTSPPIRCLDGGLQGGAAAVPALVRSTSRTTCCWTSSLA